MPFDRADRHRAMTRLLDHAGGFAEAVLRANPPANLWHHARFGRKFIGVFEAALRRRHQPIGNVIAERAARLAKRHPALRAAAGLSFGLRLDEIGINFKEIADARARCALAGKILLDRGKF